MMYLKYFWFTEIMCKVLYSKDRKHLYLQAYFHSHKFSLKGSLFSINGGYQKHNFSSPMLDISLPFLLGNCLQYQPLPPILTLSLHKLAVDL